MNFTEEELQNLWLGLLYLEHALDNMLNRADNLSDYTDLSNLKRENARLMNKIYKYRKDDK